MFTGVRPVLVVWEMTLDLQTKTLILTERVEDERNPTSDSGVGGVSQESLVTSTTIATLGESTIF